MWCFGVSRAGRVLFSGDAHDATLEHIRENYADMVADVESDRAAPRPRL